VRQRTQAREIALKALYLYDLRGELPEGGLDAVCEAEHLPTPSDFARELVEGSLAHRDELDGIIQETAENWRLERMPFVDRNILRLATYELVLCQDTPPKVVINEAIEMAKKYSTENSPTFVNGVLDKIYSVYAPDKKAAEEQGAASAADAEMFSHAILEHWTPDPLQRADLHVHSSASDGSLTPEEIVREAVKHNLAAVALCDHDTVAGVLPAARLAEEIGIRLIPGVELSAYTEDLASGRPLELHILGLFVDPTDAQFVGELERLQQVRITRIRTISGKLHALDVDFDAEAVLEQATGESVGRVHVARELVRQGHCSDIREAFDRYLAADKPAYVAKERLTPEQAIRLVHHAGGCAVAAHPAHSMGALDMLEELKRVGLDGVEVHYPSQSDQDEARLLDAARRLQLAVSGGSDFHGEAKPDSSIGQEAVSLVEVCELVERSKTWRRLARIGPRS